MFLRRTIEWIAVLALCGTTQLLAQQPHPHPNDPLDALLRPHGHGQPVPANTQKTPQIVFDAGNLGSPLSLDKGWRVGISSNPAIAQPDFDDSTWVIRNATESFADVPDEDHPAGAPDGKGKPGSDGQSGPPPGHQRPFAWFRLHIKLAPNHGPVSLLVELPVTQNMSINVGTQTLGADVFANGKQIQPEGPHGSDPERYQQISRIYNLNIPANETSLTLVLRTIYVPFGFGAYTTFFSSRALRLGSPED